MGVTAAPCSAGTRSQQGQPAPAQPLSHALEMLLDEVGTEVRVERLRIGPAEHLVLQQRIINAVEEFPEPDQQVTLGHQQVNREADIQRALNQIQLLGQMAGLVLDGLRRVTDEALDGEHKKEAVDRAMRTRAFEQTEELTPLGGLTRPRLVENHRTRRIEDNRAIGEPPIHVDGATRTLQLILQPRREINARMTDGFGLAGAGFADDDIPWQLINVLAPAFELLESFLELLPHPVQVSALVRVADCLGRGRRLRLEGGRKPLALAAGAVSSP